VIFKLAIVAQHCRAWKPARLFLDAIHNCAASINARSESAARLRDCVVVMTKL
jgi:hypothetical protein